MTLKGSFQDANPWSKLLIAALLIVLGLSITTAGLYFVNNWFIHLPASFLNSMANNPDPVWVRAAKVMQMAYQIGGFLLPALLAAHLFSTDNYASLWRRNGLTLTLAAMVALMMLLLLPGINYMALLNEKMHLPAILGGLEDWMRQMQLENDGLVETFVTVQTPADFALNVLVMAVLPALSEELIFRGVLQSLFVKMTRNPHVGIWLAAIVFSSFHMQFFGFFPRLLLGVIFGYLLYWSGNIWYPILAHFVNNAAALVLVLIYGPEVAEATPMEMDSFGTWAGVAVLTVLSLALLWRLKARMLVSGHRV